MRIFEIYSKEHGDLKSYLHYAREPKEEFEFYMRDNSYLVIEWLEKKFHDLENFNQRKGTDLYFSGNDDFTDFDQDNLNEIYSELTLFEKNELLSFCERELAKSAPEELPTSYYINPKKILPRNTWLIHFSHNAKDIYDHGFKFGTEDMDKLGLTTRFNKTGEGWNFAFSTSSTESISQSCRRGRSGYGSAAVMFQSSGVLIDHRTDMEQQVIFQGKNVNPHDMVLLIFKDAKWNVMPRRGDRPVYFNADILKVIVWVEFNYQQYRKVFEDVEDNNILTK